MVETQQRWPKLGPRTPGGGAGPCFPGVHLWDSRCGPQVKTYDWDCSDPAAVKEGAQVWTPQDVWWGKGLQAQRPQQGLRSQGLDHNRSFLWDKESTPRALGLALTGEGGELADFSLTGALGFYVPSFPSSPLAAPPKTWLLPPVDVESGEDLVPGRAHLDVLFQSSFFLSSLPPSFPFFQYLVSAVCQGCCEH